MLEKRTSRQWYDPQLNRFLPDRLVRGTCPNPKCDYDSAYSDECDRCGHQHEPTALINPKSVLSNATPEMRDTVHWWLDMWKVSEMLRAWIEGQEEGWRPSVIAETLEKVLPSLRFDGEHEAAIQGAQGHAARAQEQIRPGQEGGRCSSADKADLENGPRGAGGGGHPVDARRRVGAPIDHPRHRLGRAGAGHRSGSGGQDPLRLARLADRPHRVLAGGAGQEGPGPADLRRVLARSRGARSPSSWGRTTSSSTCSCRGRCGWGRRTIRSACRCRASCS